jgi:ornithine decarboxylase
MTARIREFLDRERPPTPCLVVDLDEVEANYRALAEALPLARIYYAVKANPAKPVVERLIPLGSYFDAASIYEIEHLLACGTTADHISFGHTVKKQGDIERAYRLGVRMFAFDSAEELQKLAKAAPGASVFCRILVSNASADWPLSDKFGCNIEMARDLIVSARDLGLDPYGVSFHVGSQQRDPSQWDMAIGKTAMLFTDLAERGIELRMVNLGGGFPARYRQHVEGVPVYAKAIMDAMTKHFGNRLPQMVIEPGRGLVGDSGMIQSEVVLVSRKSYDAERRWVYLDIGKFGGLPETMGEAIQYRIVTPKDGGPTGPVVLAGPTCDEVDILYDKANYQMPLALAPGDKVEIHAAGAYTATYCSVGFNGFPPLREYYI